MSRRVGKDITRLCLDMAYAAAAYLCPAVRRSARAYVRKEAYAKRTDAARMLVERLCLFSSMIPAPAMACQPLPEEGREAFVCKLGEQEYCLGLSDVRKTCPSPDRRNKRPRKSGLELIRLTLNLARGNLEQSSHFTAAPAV